MQSSHNANGYYTIYGDETDYNDHFNAKLVTGATTEVYARTGYLGFLRRTECSQSVSVLDETTPSIASRDSDNDSINSLNQSHANLIPTTGNSVTLSEQGESEQHDAVYVVGALDEVIALRGMNYHPIDIENSVLRCHKRIAERYVIIVYSHGYIFLVVYFTYKIVVRFSPGPTCLSLSLSWMEMNQKLSILYHWSQIQS